eukprot:scaffold949_cov186-Alexandrium_tamarense.AAC.9
MNVECCFVEKWEGKCGNEVGPGLVLYDVKKKGPFHMYIPAKTNGRLHPSTHLCQCCHLDSVQVNRAALKRWRYRCSLLRCLM